MGESISPNDLIFGGDYCESDKDKECLEKVIATISANEEKFKVFHKSDYEIYEIICFNMSQVYNDSILELYRKDPFAFALLISTFFGQQTCLGTDQMAFTYVKFPLHTSLLLCYAAREMEKRFFGKDEARKERYDRLGDHWERTALRILDELYEYNPEYATIALKIDYREKLRENNHKMSVTSEVISQKRIRWYQNCVRWYSDYLDCKYNQSRELMSIAYFANASQFLSHYTCRDIVNNRANSRKLWLKWLFNLIFRLLYVVLFAIILIFGNPWHDTKSESESKISKNTLMGFWVYIMLFLLAQTLVSFLKLVDKINVYQLNYNSKTTFEKFLPKKRHLKFARRYLEQNTLSMFRMMLFAILFIFEAIRLMLKVIPRKSEGYDGEIGSFGISDIFLPLVSDFLYCIIFAISAVTTLRYFQTTSIGLFIRVLKKMLKTVGMFAIIFLFFWLILAIIVTRLTNKMSNSTNSWFYDLQSTGKFEIFGEIDDEEKTGISKDCEGYKNYTTFDKMDYQQASCFLRAIFIPYLFFFYMFFSGILLINLLTAQLTKEYDEICENSKYYMDYVRYEYTSKLESKNFLPPPLSLVYIVIKTIFCIPCVSFRLSEFFEGTEFGAYRCENLVEDDVEDVCNKAKNIVRNDMCLFWKDLNKTVKNAAEKYDITLENLEKIQDELENVIKMYSDKLRPQTRIGHRQTLDYQGDQSPMPIVDSIERLSSSNVMEAPRFVAGSTIEDNNFRRPSVMNFESQNKPKFSVGSTVENDDSRSPSVQIPVESETSESHGLLQNDESNVQTWFSGCTIS